MISCRKLNGVIFWQKIQRFDRQLLFVLLLVPWKRMPWVRNFHENTIDLTPEKIKELVALLEKEQVAYDVGGYRDAPPSLRIW